MSDYVLTLKPLQDALVNSIKVSQLITILTAIIGVGMAFVLMWFACKNLKNIFINAVEDGRLGNFGDRYRAYDLKRWQKKQYKYEVKHNGYKGSYHDYWGE